MSLYLDSRLTAALVGTALLAGTAQAQQTATFSDSIASQVTNWSETLTIPKWDPSLYGNAPVLQSIDIDFTGGTTGQASIENLDAAPATIITDFTATIVLQRPDTTTILSVNPGANFSDPLAAFDGTIDFGGASGIIHPNITSSETQSGMYVPPSPDMALFTGVGDILLPVGAAASSTASGAGNIITQFNTEATADVTVIYTYINDCNQNGIDDSLDIAGGMPDIDQDGIPDECQPDITIFCRGDGLILPGSVMCPCGNASPTGEAAGCMNSGHTGGKLRATGNPSIANDTIVLTSSRIPHVEPGFFFFGTTEIVPNMWDNGVICIGGTLTRMLKIQGGSNGGFLPGVGDPPISFQYGITAGQTTYFQYWYRNGNGPCGGSVNATNGVRITWGL